MIRFRLEMVKAPGLTTKAIGPSPGKWGQRHMPQARAAKGIQFICFLLFMLIFLMTTTGLLGSLCFFISSDYNARTFSFCQEIASAIAAAAAVSFLESAHCVSCRIPELAQFGGPALGCCVQFWPFAPAEGCQISQFSNNLPPSDIVTESWPHRSHLAVHLTTCHMLSIHSPLKCLLSTFFVPGTVLFPASTGLTI